MKNHEELRRISIRLTEQGKLIEAGFVSLMIAVMPPDAPPVQIKEMRKAFMAGAQHLFASIMTIMDADREPTEADMKHMDLIDKELRAFGEELKREIEQLNKRAKK